MQRVSEQKGKGYTHTCFLMELMVREDVSPLPQSPVSPRITLHLVLLQQGVRFDPDLPQTIRLEFAKSNTKVSKPKSQSALVNPVTSMSQPPLVHPLTGRK